VWKLEEVGEQLLNEFGKPCDTDKLQDSVCDTSGITLREARGPSGG